MFYFRNPLSGRFCQCVTGITRRSQRMHDQLPVIVIGAGLAGLTSARMLHRAGFPVRVLEAAPEIGGRLRTHAHPDGFLIDRGFQILFAGYPALRRQVDLDALGARPFDAGTHVWTGSRMVPLKNPLRHPKGIGRDLTSPVFGMADKVRLARWGAGITSAQWMTATNAATIPEDRSALSDLRAHGFSESFIDRFARPFWGGITLDRSLSTSAGVLRYTAKMLLEGEGVLPGEGVGAVPRAIAAELPDGAIQTATAVDGLVIEGTRVTGVRQDGSTVDAAAVIVATDPPAAARLTGIGAIPTDGVGCVTVYLASDRDPGLGRMLAIDGTGAQPVNHIAPLSAVQPSYAPESQHLLAAVLLGDDALARDDEENGRIARESVAIMLGRGSLRVVDVVRVPFSLYRQPPGIHRRLPDAITGMQGLFLATHNGTVDASINGAIMSGEDAAHAVIMAIGDRVSA
jgi:phytoene dehydrogenase-like protein